MKSAEGEHLTVRKFLGEYFFRDLEWLGVGSPLRLSSGGVFFGFELAEDSGAEATHKRAVADGTGTLESGGLSVFFDGNAGATLNPRLRMPGDDIVGGFCAIAASALDPSNADDPRTIALLTEDKLFGAGAFAFTGQARNGFVAESFCGLLRQAFAAGFDFRRINYCIIF